jgi:hypothetical protein
MARTGCRNDPGQLIAVDSSALMAIILGEPEASYCMNILAYCGRCICLHRQVLAFLKPPLTVGRMFIRLFGWRNLIG